MRSYYLPKARTNYGIFNIRFQGPSVWNSIDEDIKSSSLSLFKQKMKQHLIKDYWTSVLRFRFCNSKIRNNTLLQRKNYGHFNIQALYLTLFNFTFVCIYVCLFLCP